MKGFLLRGMPKSAFLIDGSSSVWSDYSDLTRLKTPKKQNPLVSRKSYTLPETNITRIACIAFESRRRIYHIYMHSQLGISSGGETSFVLPKAGFQNLRIPGFVSSLALESLPLHLGGDWLASWLGDVHPNLSFNA